MGRSIVAAWALMEILTYALVLSNFSILVALLAGVASTLVGLFTLRLVGQGIARDAAAAAYELTSGSGLTSLPAAVLGAILLLLPGFLSDAVGLLLVAFGARSLLQRRGSRPSEGYVELSRDEWTRLPDEPPR